MAVEQGFDYLLTMDQDSKADEAMVFKLLELMQSTERIGIVSAEHYDKDIHNPIKPENFFVKNVLSTITSGNLLSLNAYKITGDIPGINYLLSSFYLHAGSIEKALRHLSLAVNMDKEVFKDFKDIFPNKLFTRKIRKLLDENGLLV